MLSHSFRYSYWRLSDASLALLWCYPTQILYSTITLLQIGTTLGVLQVECFYGLLKLYRSNLAFVPEKSNLQQWSLGLILVASLA